MKNIEAAESPAKKKPGDFLIVGIGASAGGIQALKSFFEQVPQDSGMAYVVILHLSPDYDSKLAEVLQVATATPVTQVTEKVTIEPNHVYVISPNHHLIMEDGFILPTLNLQIEDRRAPVDIFFRTLADAHGPRSVAVVLSGTGANGSMGLKRIKEMGGVVFVQNPREAGYNEMPRNSIATDLVDEVLPVTEIPFKILAYRNRLGTIEIKVKAAEQSELQQRSMREIFTHLRLHTGHDFTNYKQATLLRRIERRINIRNLPGIVDYASYLQQYPDEVTALLKDLLISVTNFFRDQKAFHIIESQVLPAIFKRKTYQDQVRIWVAGCATGEEAYSIAMLCAERTLGGIDMPQVQVFATDIDEAAIAVAREGLYTINDAADVLPERLHRFFSKDGDGYRVRKEIREMVLFAKHNFLKDPPFSRVDMVTCRNVLIYLNHIAQERVMETFHFALKPAGFLFLGSSETVDGASDLYAISNRENHIYQSRQVSARSFPVPESIPDLGLSRSPVVKPVEKQARSNDRISVGELHQKLLEEYAPPSVVINEEYEIIHMSEKVGRYFEFTGGEPTQNLLKVIRPELRIELRTALYQAVQHQIAVEARNVKIVVDDQPRSLNLHIRPALKDATKGFILIIFEQNEDEPERSEVTYSSNEPLAKQLEDELVNVKTQLRNSIEQHEFQEEELKASNEELQAMNEELRSAAEELETSKEELQSINEELRTVNQELKVKIDETTLTSNNLQNLINSADIGTIFLDRSFQVVLFTPAIRDIFNLISSDFGRPITDITNRLNYTNLLHDAETVLEKLNVVEREVQTTDKKVFLMRILPYLTMDDHINGVVITFFNITERKSAEEALRQSEEKYRLQLEYDVEERTKELNDSREQYLTLVENIPDVITRWNKDLKLVFANSAFESKTGLSSDSLFGKTNSEIGEPDDIALPYINSLQKAFETSETVEHFNSFAGKQGETHFYTRITPEKNTAGEVETVLTIARDITEIKKAEQEILRLRDEVAQKTTDKYYSLFNSVDEGFGIMELLHDENGNTSDLVFREVNKSFERHTGLKDVVGKTASELLPGFKQNWIDIYTKVAQTGETFRSENYVQDVDRWFSLHFSLVGEKGSSFVAVVFDDITKRKKTEEYQAYSLRLSDALRPLSNENEVKVTAARMLLEHLALDRILYMQHVHKDGEDHWLVDDVYQMPGYSYPTGLYPLTTFGEDAYAALLQGKTIIVNNVENEPGITPEVRNNLVAASVSAFVAQPSMKNGQCVAVFTCQQSTPRIWKPDELALLEKTGERTLAAVERAKAEEALRKSEERLQKALQIETVGVLFFDNEGTFTDANDAFIKMSGLTHQQVNERRTNTEQITLPEWMPRTKQALEELQQTGRTTPYEKQLVKPNGSQWWGLFAAAKLTDTENVEFAIDVTDRKHAEDKLRESEERLRTLADAVPQVIWSNDEQGKANYFNKRWYEYSGLNYKESVGKGWEAIVHPDDAPASVEKWHEALAAGQIFDTEYRLRNKDGNYCWFIGRNVPLKDNTGKLMGWFGSATDIEDVKKAEAKLLNTAASLQLALDAGKLGSYEYDFKTGEIISTQQHKANFGFAEKDHFSFEELKNIIIPEDRMQMEREVERSVEEHEIYNSEYRIHVKTGDLRWIRSVGRVVYNESNEPEKMVGITLDITGQKLFTEELSRQVNERTTELQRSNEDLRQFAHVASHDLKEPVRKVQTFSNRLRDEFSHVLPVKGQLYLDKVKSATDRMYAMIEGVLNYSKFNIAPPVLKPVNLNKLIQHIETDLEVLIHSKNAQITTSNLPTLTASNVLMYQLFYNLILNSLKFAKAGEQSLINVSCTVKEQDNRQFYEISVSDNGIGFNEEFKEVIFNTFTKLNPADEYEGTGLGLALCKKIVERHNGHISAMSSEGEGAKFTILLPVS